MQKKNQQSTISYTIALVHSIIVCPPDILTQIYCKSFSKTRQSLSILQEPTKNTVYTSFYSVKQ